MDTFHVPAPLLNCTGCATARSRATFYLSICWRMRCASMEKHSPLTSSSSKTKRGIARRHVLTPLAVQRPPSVSKLAPGHNRHKRDPPPAPSPQSRRLKLRRPLPNPQSGPSTVATHPYPLQTYTTRDVPAGARAQFNRQQASQHAHRSTNVPSRRRESPAAQQGGALAAGCRRPTSAAANSSPLLSSTHFITMTQAVAGKGIYRVGVRSSAPRTVSRL